MIMMLLVIVVIILLIIVICYLDVRNNALSERNQQLESDCRTLRNMYFNLKSIKLDDSEWKDMTSSQITKVILEQKYKEGKLDVEALLNEGRIVEKNSNSVLIDALVGRSMWFKGY